LVLEWGQMANRMVSHQKTGLMTFYQ